MIPLRQRLVIGACLMVFPEGSRSSDGQLKKFKPGMFLLAIENKLPVVPVSIRGSRIVMPKGRLAVSPATVHVYIHEPIDTRSMTRDDARALAERARDIIAAQVHGADRA